MTRIKGGGVAPSTSITINPYMIFQNNQQRQQQQQQQTLTVVNAGNGVTGSTSLAIPSSFDAAKLALMQNVYSHLVNNI